MQTSNQVRRYGGTQDKYRRCHQADFEEGHCAYVLTSFSGAANYKHRSQGSGNG
jgi:hypothetical protein